MFLRALFWWENRQVGKKKKAHRDQMHKLPTSCRKNQAEEIFQLHLGYFLWEEKKENELGGKTKSPDGGTKSSKLENPHWDRNWS